MFIENVLSPILNSLTSFAGLNSFYINDSFWTYRDFAVNISKIRSRLQELSFKGENIGIVANDDIETYSALIAVWLEGLCYVPIHPRYPVERGLEILKQAEINLIIDSSEKPVFESVMTIGSKKLSFSQLNLEPKLINDSNNAYILFTSGSTGKPKGVPISRQNLAAFMEAFWKVGFKIDQNDRCLQCFDLTFDVSVQSFIVPLSRGASVFTIPHDRIKYSYVYELLDEKRLTFGAMAPSMVRFLRPYFDEIDLPELRYCILTAEASPLSLVEEWSRCIPNAEIYDFYGPTEATIYCTYYKFLNNNTNKHLNGMLSIGKPLDGTIAVISDESNNFLGRNKKGELCISGDQITKGYWNYQEKTNMSFFEMEFQGKSCRFYKTGDLCYIDDEGDIMYSGRLDFQVKIQGFRIELGEIEYHAREYTNGRNVVAVAFENKSGSNEIALFFESEHDNSSGLLEYLKSKMPYYMVPSRLIHKNEFPLNSNGKIDRNILRISLII
jgi:D-alanine--poly(phosphoribitol) ligase subunit 1